MEDDIPVKHPHPEVKRREIDIGGLWPVDQPFPLTPLEAWYLLQGWEMAPAAGTAGDQVLQMPGKIEGGNGWLHIWQP